MDTIPLKRTSISPRRYIGKTPHLFLEIPFNFQPQTLTITNVTLKTGPGYTLVFTNTSNSMNDYAHSSEFEVKDAGSQFFLAGSEFAWLNFFFP